MAQIRPNEIARILENDSENEEIIVEHGEHFVVASNLIDEHFGDTVQDDVENVSSRANLNTDIENSKKQSTSKYENKRKREEGNKYCSRKKTEEGFVLVTKNKRVLGPACTSKRCDQYKNSRFCSKLTEQNRSEIFKEFWQMSWDQRMVFVKSMVDIVKPNTQTTYNTVPNRESTMKYYLKINKVRTQVCKFTFLNTLAIKPSTLRQWLVAPTPPKPREKKMAQRVSNNMDRRKLHLKEFFENVNKVPSHYCRRESKRLYLDRPTTSKAEAIRIYEIHAKERGIEPLSATTVAKEMKLQKISVFKPRKDQCNICVAHQEGNVEEVEFKRHIELKDLAQNQKKQDSGNKDPDTVVLCMDVQATLLCPILNCSAVYFKKKLCVHNYTFYDMKTADVSCYVWHEGEGGLESGNFASMLVDKLTEDLTKKPNIKKFILYSDGCPYQNRCVVVSNALLLFAIEKNVIVEHNYLEKGHTQMAVDSVHAVTETRLEKKMIYEPSDYVGHIQEARLSKAQYQVKYLSHDFFQDYAKIKFIEKIRPGNKTGDPTVNEIRCMLYLPSKQIQYKLNYKDEWQTLPQKINPNPPTTLINTYTESLPIQADKYQNLQELLQYIPEESRPFYSTLVSK